MLVKQPPGTWLVVNMGEKYLSSLATHLYSMEEWEWIELTWNGKVPYVQFTGIMVNVNMISKI